MLHLLFFGHLIGILAGTAAFSLAASFRILRTRGVHRRYAVFWICVTALYILNFIDSYAEISTVDFPDFVTTAINSVTPIIRSVLILTTLRLFAPPDTNRMRLIYSTVSFLPLVILTLILLITDATQNRLVLRVFSITMQISTLLILGIFGFCLRRVRKRSDDPRIARFLAAAQWTILVFVPLNLLNMAGRTSLLGAALTFSRLLVFPAFFLFWNIATVIYLLTADSPVNPNRDTGLQVFVAEYSISTRETDVLIKLEQGKSNRDIAEILYISPRTVDNHLASIYRKCKVRSRFELLSLLRGRQAK